MSGATVDPSLYRDRDVVPVRRAIVAVSDKTGLVDLARALADAGVEIVSTGGTSKAIAEAGIPVTQIGDLTGFPEHLDGRVRTLHPKVHSGLLADLRLESHEEELAKFDIAPFELAVINLYPFAQTVASGMAARTAKPSSTPSTTITGCPGDQGERRTAAPIRSPLVTRAGSLQALTPGSRRGVAWMATGARSGHRHAAAIRAGYLILVEEVV